MEWEGQDVDDLLANTTVDISECCLDSDSPLEQSETEGEREGGREGRWEEGRSHWVEGDD